MEKKDITLEKGMGAKLNAPDNRDISMTMAAFALGMDGISHPKENITNISMLPVEDQKDKGTCVGQAEGKGEEYRDYKETRNLVRGSKKFIYKHCKMLDGNDSIQGTYPRIAARVLKDLGMPREELVPDDNNAPYDEYMKADVESPVIKTDASARRVKGHSFVRTLDELKTAIDINGVFNCSLLVGDWGSLPVKPKYQDGSDRGLHRVLVYGYKDAFNGSLADTKIYFRNSWGTNWTYGGTQEDKNLLAEGNGWFWWSEYQNYFYDGMAYMDMPNEIIEYAKSQNYIFTRTLQKGSEGTDVRELQKRLAKEKALDGRPCYRENYYDTKFGPATERSVQRYQAKELIVVSGTPQTTGYGRVGPKTLARLNEGQEIRPTGLFPVVEDMKNKLVDIMSVIGSPIVVTDEYRSIEEQDELYAQGRTKPGKIVTDAKGGDSFHNWRCAFDVAFKTNNGFTYDGDWEKIGRIGEIIGLEWGGRWQNFPDRPHFQFTAGYTIQDFKNGKVDPRKFGEITNNVSSVNMENIKAIFESPSKLVFILIALALIAFTAAKIVDAKIFNDVVLMVFSFYFGTQFPSTTNPGTMATK